jgi:hypothetical protein
MRRCEPVRLQSRIRPSKGREGNNKMKEEDELKKKEEMTERERE